MGSNPGYLLKSFLLYSIINIRSTIKLMPTVLKFLYNFKTTLALLCSRNESKSPSPHLAIISDFIGTRQRGPRLGFCVSKFSLNPLKFSLTRKNWHKKWRAKSWAIYSLISIRQNCNFHMSAMIWHEIVCWFLKIYPLLTVLVWLGT